MFRQNKKMIVGVVIGLLMAASVLLADVPNLIDYQGRLSDTGGSPVNGNVSILFSIYDVETGGTELWSETQNVDVDNGLFQVTLGSSYAMPDTLFNEPDRWLGITVGTDVEMTPRSKIVSVAYAKTDDDWEKRGNDLYYEDGKIVVGAENETRGIKIVARGDVDIQGKIFAEWMRLEAGAREYAAKLESNSDIGPTVEITQSGSDKALVVTGRSTFSDNVGIGTETPDAKLDIVAEAIAAFNATSSGLYTHTATFENTGSGHAAKFIGNSNYPAARVDQNGTGSALEVNAFGGNDGLYVTTSGPGNGVSGSFMNYTDGNGLNAESHGTGNAAQFANYGSNGTALSIANFLGMADAFYSGAYADGLAAYFDGDGYFSGNLGKASGSFLIDHPLDPANKYLYHSFVESPDMMNVYNGNVILGNNGEATVELPHYFETINMEFRYQLTPLGASAPNLYIAEKISGNRFKIAGGKSGLEVSWQVTGIRNDPYAKAHRIIVEKDKPANEKGKYLHPELYGQSEEKGMRYEAKMQIMNSRKK